MKNIAMLLLWVSSSKSAPHGVINFSTCKESACQVSQPSLDSAIKESTRLQSGGNLESEKSVLQRLAVGSGLSGTKGTDEWTKGTDDVTKGTDGWTKGTYDGTKGTDEWTKGTYDLNKGTDGWAKGTYDLNKGTDEWIKRKYDGNKGTDDLNVIGVLENDGHGSRSKRSFDCFEINSGSRPYSSYNSGSTKSHISCQWKCQHDFTCKWFNWLPNKGGCWLLRYDRTSVTTGDSTHGWVTGPSTHGWVTGPKYCSNDCFSDNTGSRPYSSFNSGSTSSHFRCQRKCQRDSTCKWFNWLPNNGGCWLLRYDRTGVKIGDSTLGWITGPKYCPSLRRLSSESLWDCLHLVSRGRQCIGAIINQVPCVNIAKNIFDVINTAIKEHGRDACKKQISAAVSLPVNAVGCATFGTGAIAEKFSGDWVKVQLANQVAIKMPGKLAAWLGCPK